MGCSYSRVDREEVVSRCKARRRYMKQLVKARQAFSVAHSMYLRSLIGTGSALLQFANAETNLYQAQHQNHLQNDQNRLLSQPLPPPPPPPISSSFDDWTSGTASPAQPPPPPPPPPLSSWDFWDPFPPSSSKSVTEEEWASEVGTTAVAASVAAPPSVVSTNSKESTSELVDSKNIKDLVEIIKELDEYFLKAADAGVHVSLLLQVSNFGHRTQKTTGKFYNCEKSLSPLWMWGSNSNSSGIGRFGEELIGADGGGGVLSTDSHSSTVERLYALEKKLYQEVKNAESISIEHKKKVGQLRKQGVKGAGYLKTEKSKKEIEKLESRMVVVARAMQTTSAEIIRVREAELYPQLLQLLNGLMSMWKSMYECHRVQTHIVEQLKFLNASILPTGPTSEIHRQLTLQLELEVQQWHLAFCNLVQFHRDYIHSLTGWLRLSLFQFSHDPLTNPKQNSAIYSLCEEWELAMDRIPDKVASEGIKSLLTVIHAVVVQQAEEQKQNKKAEAAFKELEKREVELRSLECKYGPLSMPETHTGTRHLDPAAEKLAKVGILRTKAEEEKTKHEKLVSVTMAMTLNNLQMGLSNVFQGMTGFSNVCIHAFESMSNRPKYNEQNSDLKMILP
ncbi:hypothetical protein NE237_023992 [Protea cynaroides]|uniref:Nitrate regulatory gene2 protein-like n=1 Tax=Protea cynaroides TaxID=273540 RepID=A0A9Q0K6V7_9MAGN|nr:hypothetical protein NE237_023992 [Protea cynaroides]